MLEKVSQRTIKRIRSMLLFLQQLTITIKGPMIQGPMIQGSLGEKDYTIMVYREGEIFCSV